MTGKLHETSWQQLARQNEHKTNIQNTDIVGALWEALPEYQQQSG